MGSLCAAEHGVIAVGADNMAWDVPGERDPDTGATLFAHVYLLAQKGVYIIENLNLEELRATAVIASLSSASRSSSRAPPARRCGHWH